MTTVSETGYAPINGLELYYEIHGEGEPLVLLHGAFGATGMFGGVVAALAAQRRVIAVDLQAHGRTADIERPMRYETLADDIAALLGQLGYTRTAVMGYSLGGGVALQTAIRHPDLVERLIVVSSPHKRAGWYPDIVAGLDHIGREQGEQLKGSPMHDFYVQIAPRPDDWGNLWDRMGELERRDFDWSAEVARLTMPTMLVVGDADSIPPVTMAEFFGLLGGGQRDGNWDRSGVTPHRLAILPDRTHYDIVDSSDLAEAVVPFLISA